MTFLYILFFFIIFILLSAVGIIRVVLRTIFGKSNSTHNSRTSEGRQSGTKWFTYEKKREKVFDNNDGEYIDFEEIKDDK